MTATKYTRIYSRTYSIPVEVPTRTLFNSSTKLYLNPAPYLRNIKVAAIDFQYGENSNIFYTNSVYLTLVDNNNDTRLFNYPVNDLSNNFIAGTQSAPYRLRLFKFDGIITENCYFTISTNTPASLVAPVIAGYINFYEL